MVISAGPAMNLLIAFLIFWGLYGLRGPAVATDKVEQLTTKSAAAGILRPGDRILAVDGVRGGPDVAAQADRHAPLRRRPDRRLPRGRRRPAGDRPRRPAADRHGHAALLQGGRPRAASASPSACKADPQGPIEAAGSSVSGMWSVSKATVNAITRIFYDSKARKEVSGVVGSYETTRQAINKFGFVDALNILAVISLSLAIVNLFPFLPLDGGHIFWALAEKLRGRAIAVQRHGAGQRHRLHARAVPVRVGLSNDIGRLQGQGFGVR